MGNPEPNPAFRKQTKHKGSEREIKKDRCRDSMEAVLTNGVDCDALVTESFHRNSRKDEG